MKPFIKWLNILLTFMEIASVILTCFGVLFGQLDLPGHGESLLVGFTLLAITFLLRAITPFYKRNFDGSPILNDLISLALRRILYLALIIYALALSFLSNQLNGTQEMLIIAAFAVGLSSLASIILITIQKERMKIFRGVLIKLVVLIVLHSLLFI